MRYIRTKHLLIASLAALTYLEANTVAFAGNEAEVSKQLIGAWSKSTQADKETGDVETTLIQFNADGSYRTRLQSKLFGETKNMASGRFAVSDASKDSFTLNIEVLKGDPEMEKEDTAFAAKVRIVNVNTLQTEDGQMLRRVK